jgi:hypothetical protein
VDNRTLVIISSQGISKNVITDATGISSQYVEPGKTSIAVLETGGKVGVMPFAFPFVLPPMIIFPDLTPFIWNIFVI